MDFFNLHEQKPVFSKTRDIFIKMPPREKLRGPRSNQMSLAGIEPAFLAPEANALSVELQGQISSLHPSLESLYSKGKPVEM